MKEETFAQGKDCSVKLA
jgi:hypothetical protein